MFAETFANFIDGEHAGANIEIINLCLLQRIQGAILLPYKFDVTETEVTGHDEIDGVCQVAEDWYQPFRGGLLDAGLGGGAVHDADKLLRGETKRVTNDAGNPFVERVLQHGIAGKLEVAAFGNEGNATTTG